MNGRAVVDFDQCMGCGICTGQCRQGAIELVRMESKGEPLSINSPAPGIKAQK
jgi:Fe-S-cluster-containing hydrogenase component 2